MKQLLSLCAVVVLGLSQTASAQTPEDLAHRCAERVDSIVERYTNIAVDETHEALRIIHELLEAGRYEAARQTAHESIRRARHRTELAADLIQRLCNVCVAELLELGEPELARRLHNYCEDAVLHLRHLLIRQTNAILDPFEE